MGKLSSKLGKSYEIVADQTKIKKATVDLGEVKFDIRVRVPLKKEMEEITAKIVNPPEDKVAKLYDKFAAPLRKTLEEGGKEFLEAINKEKQTIELLDDDLIVDGKSVKQIATFAAIEETRVEEYFHLLVSETNEPVTETYDEITSEFPEFAVQEILKAIDQAIKPDYKTVKKN
jgi:hypothetical protein